jgi:hypothetical protein
MFSLVTFLSSPLHAKDFSDDWHMFSSGGEENTNNQYKNVGFLGGVFSEVQITEAPRKNYSGFIYAFESLPYYQTKGLITFSEKAEGLLIVDAFNTSSTNQQQHPYGVSYNWDLQTTQVIYQLHLTPGSYTICAFIDTNASSEYEKGEPVGYYNNEAIVIENADDSTDRNINLTIYPDCIKGDVDEDNEITPQDAVDAFHLSFQTSWLPEQICRADLDGDNVISPQDAVDIFWASF